jgi:hypothetical protein
MFKTPVWTLELIRDTDAPFERVREVLLDGPRYGAWHPVYRQASPRVVNEEAGAVEIDWEESPFPGVTERAHFLIREQDGRVVLLYAGRFKGWAVPLLLGLWRLERRDLWERFVRAL